MRVSQSAAVCSISSGGSEARLMLRDPGAATDSSDDGSQGRPSTASAHYWLVSPAPSNIQDRSLLKELFNK